MCLFNLVSKTAFDIKHQPQPRNDRRWIFSLQHPAPIQNGTPNQILGTPTFGSQNRPIKMPPTYFRLDVPNLEILPCGDIPSISTNSIMPFHNVDPKLLHCFIQLHQIGLRSASRSNICGFAPLSLGSI